MSKKKELRNSRTLDEFAADIVAHQRSNIFEIGELLLQAKEQHPGDFLDWLYVNEQDLGSVRSAENKMGAALLKRRFGNIANLKVGKTTVYHLVAFDKDHSTLTEIAIGALAAQTKGARLKHSDAEKIIELVRLRGEFGDYPDATLFALDDIATTKRPKPWHAKTTEILKNKRPETEEEADALILGVLQEHLEGLYGRAIPAIAVPHHARDILERLARVPGEDRARVFGRLKAPVTEDMAFEAMKPEPATPPASEPVTPSSTTATASSSEDAEQSAEKRKRLNEETEEESKSNGSAKPESDPKAIIRACLDEVVPAVRVAITGLDTKGRLILLDEIRKAISGLMREVTARDADAGRWAETTH